MAMSQNIIVRGINFAFHAGLYTGDGVVVEDRHDIDDPEFIPALKQAIALHNLWAAAVEIEQYAHTYAKNYSDAQLKNHMYGVSDEHIEMILENYDLAKQQDVLEITDDIIRYVRFSENEMSRREMKQIKEQVKEYNRALRPNEKRPGYVYLIQSPTGMYKIGRTANPDDRMKTFSIKLPFEVQYVCLIQAENMFALERELHGYFEHKRVNGEWFDLKPHDVEYIKGLAK